MPGLSPVERTFPARVPSLGSVLALALVSIALVPSTSALAKLPPPTDEARAIQVAASAKAAWGAKVAAFQLCQVQDRLAKRFGAPAGSTPAGTAPAAQPGCTDPGPFEPVAATTKAMESAGAHSPAAPATQPPAAQAPPEQAPAPR